MREKSATRRSRVFFLLKLVLGLTLIGSLLWFIKPQQVLEALKQADLRIVAFAYIFSLTESIFYAIQLYLGVGIQKISLSLWQMIRIQFIGAFYATVLPGDWGGTVAKWYRISGREGQRAEAAALLLYTRLINTILMFGIGFLAGAVTAGPANAELATLLAVVSCLILIFSLPLFSTKAACFADRFVQYFLKRSYLPESIQQKLNKIWDACLAFNKLPSRIVWGIFVTALVPHFIGVAVLGLACLAFGIQVDLYDLFCLRALIYAARMLPATPGGLGLREGTMVAILPLVSTATGAEAFAVSMVLLGRQFFWAIIGGVFEFQNWIVGDGMPKEPVYAPEGQ